MLDFKVGDVVKANRACPLKRDARFIKARFKAGDVGIVVSIDHILHNGATYIDVLMTPNTMLKNMAEYYVVKVDFREKG